MSQQLNWKFENWPMFQSTGLKIPSLTPISYSEKADLASSHEVAMRSKTNPLRASNTIIRFGWIVLPFGE
ncbi:MAG: hypothetical protein KDI47_04545 [Gammaproteobacteria bacterium]|nr:hypothetical protein [Gammaproteobacteria bacterium]